MAVIPTPPLGLKPMSEFDACLASWQASCQKLVNDDYTARFSSLKPPTIERHGGKKYIKFVSVSENGRGSVYAFVDARNGNIYMPATWKAPALNKARGNILDADNGMAWMTWCGVQYLT